jgi:cell division protein FtsB
MKFFVIFLVVAVIFLQGRLWLSDQGMREVSRLRSAIEQQDAANRGQAARNRQLAAEVSDLKTGMTAFEERARSELGMVGSNETFYQVVSPGTEVPPATAAHPLITARAQ